MAALQGVSMSQSELQAAWFQEHEAIKEMQLELFEHERQLTRLRKIIKEYYVKQKAEHKEYRRRMKEHLEREKKSRQMARKGMV
jgi:hypothetical protein